MSYQEAKAKYAVLGVDTGAAIERLKSIPVSLHCWQGDDVRGFDTDPGAPLTGGIQTTGQDTGGADGRLRPSTQAVSRHEEAEPSRQLRHL